MIGKNNVLSLDLLLIGEKTQKLRKTRNYHTKRTNFGDRTQKLNVEKFLEFLTILCQCRVSSTVPLDLVEDEEEDEEYQAGPEVEGEGGDESYQKAALEAFKKMNSSQAVPLNRNKSKQKTQPAEQKPSISVTRPPEDKKSRDNDTSLEGSPKNGTASPKRISKKVPYNVKENGLNKVEKAMYDKVKATIFPLVNIDPGLQFQDAFFDSKTINYMLDLVIEYNKIHRTSQKRKTVLFKPGRMSTSSSAENKKPDLRALVNKKKLAIKFAFQSKKNLSVAESNIRGVRKKSFRVRSRSKDQILPVPLSKEASSQKKQPPKGETPIKEKPTLSARKTIYEASIPSSLVDKNGNLRSKYLFESKISLSNVNALKDLSRAQTSRAKASNTARHSKKPSLDLRDGRDFTSLDLKSVLLPYNQKVIWKKRTSSCRLNLFK